MPTKKKHYRIKPIPVLLLLVALAGLAVIGVMLLTRPDDGSPVPSGESAPPALAARAPSEDASGTSSMGGESDSSDQASGALDVSPTGGEPEGGSSTASRPTSSQAAPPSSTASQPVSSQAAPPSSTASQPVSSQSPSSAEAISPTDSVYQPKADFRVEDYDLSTLPVGSLSDWNLIFLNPAKGNKIDSELGFKMTKFDDQWVDSRIADAYQSMVDGAKKDGITLYLRSGYRSIATQKANYNNAVQNYLKQGLSQEEALRRTNQYYTEPGHSEHHSGLAADILTPEYNKNPRTLDERFAKTAAYAWLREHCWDYGFILRYPKEKEKVTHISFEPWHYRYVGVEHAQYIRDHGLCFEEYVELLQAAGR